MSVLSPRVIRVDTSSQVPISRVLALFAKVPSAVVLAGCDEHPE
jgi:coenzyme F420-reducing hydrogenase delta subunit